MLMDMPGNSDDESGAVADVRISQLRSLYAPTIAVSSEEEAEEAEAEEVALTREATSPERAQSDESKQLFEDAKESKEMQIQSECAPGSKNKAFECI